ncbi:MAG: AraC family transcriptional regulator [Chthoniobacteraceae bacterium]|nr:AraC family transcriptional regulator [Chthoniobacteraceae bacterium]
MPSLFSDSAASVSIADWCYVRTGLIWAGQWEVEPQYLDAPYRPDLHLRAWWVRRGGLTITLDGGGRAEAREGEWIFPGTREGWQRFLPGTVILSMAFFAEWPSGQPLFDHEGALVFPASGQRRLSRAAQALVRKVRQVSGSRGLVLLSQSVATVENYFGIRRAFEDWLSAYVAMMRAGGASATMGRGADPRAIRAARLLDNQPLHAALSEGELARGVGLSVSQLNRLFLRDWGVSPRKYRERRQLESALALLQVHERSIKEVAYALGFRSLPHFSAWFRRLKGESPRAFQRSHPRGGAG